MINLLLVVALTASTVQNSNIPYWMESYQAGTTTYDIQANGNQGNRVAVDKEGNIHLCWMESQEITGTGLFLDRNIHYNFFGKGSEGFLWPTGVKASGILRAGYATCGVMPDGRMIVAFNERDSVTGISHSAIVVDASEGAGAFSDPLPIDTLTVPEQPLWPHMVVGSDGIIHVVGRIYTADPENPPYNARFLYYSRSTDDGGSFSAWKVIAEDAGNDPVIAVSEDGQRVAVVWGQPANDGKAPCGHLKMRESADGGESWGDAVTITENRYSSDLPQDNEYYLFAHVKDIDVAYDHWGKPQVLFCEGLFSHPESDSWDFPCRHWSRVIHWNPRKGFSLVSGPTPMFTTGDEEIDTLAMWGVVDDYAASADDYGGCYRPQIAVSGAYFIAIWGGNRDSLDLSAAGPPNGEIYYAYSYNDGRRWVGKLADPDSASTPFENITNTPSYGAGVGSCLDEDYSSVWPWVEKLSSYEGALHITYIKDIFSGSTLPKDGGTPEIITTYNPVIYMKYEVPFAEPGDEPEAITETPRTNIPALDMTFSSTNSAIHISFSSPLPQRGKLWIRNVLGQSVRVFELDKGTEAVIWDERDMCGFVVPAGVYFMEVVVGVSRTHDKATLVR